MVTLRSRGGIFHSFGAKFNTRLSALQVVLRYRTLLAVEDNFKTACTEWTPLGVKALLATRPIFHRTDPAIRGQVFCSFLALVLR